MAARAQRRKVWARRPWVMLRRAVQYVTLFVFVALFVWSRRGGWPAAIVNFPMRLDPLAMLAHLLSSRQLLGGSALALLTVILTLAVGRAWCGWLCPLGTLLDLLPLHRWRGKRTAPADAWRGVKYGLLLVILAAALLGNLTLMILDPLTILFRTLSASVWPAADQLLTAAQHGLYSVPALRPAISAMDAVMRPKILPPEPAFYRFTALYASVLAVIVALSILAPRFWCRYLCPLGALLGLLSKASVVRREVNDRCTQCQACARVCPTGTIDAARDYASDPGECTMCLECYHACPQKAIAFPVHRSPAPWSSYNPRRRQVLLALGAAVAGIGLFRSNIRKRRDHPHLIRPPGARENNLLAKCIRCGECSRACPTSAIQPAVGEAGLEGIWTPVLVPRIGYCDYSCNACGQVCPVQAIPRLSLEEKRQQVIGKAYIDHNRCIAWADHRDCIVCEEMCPVPQKAIVLQQARVLDEHGQATVVKLPEVARERCIGCGTCEYKCPVNGEAAIRVWVANDSVPEGIGAAPPTSDGVLVGAGQRQGSFEETGKPGYTSSAVAHEATGTAQEQHMDNDIIISPDTQRENRIPPGQRLTDRWPVLHYGSVPRFEPAKWTLRIWGLVQQERTLSYAEFTALPRVRVFSDIHCVTSWSRLNNLWEGVSTSVIKDLVAVLPEARFVIVHAAGGFTTNLTISDFFQPDVLFAMQHDGQPITPEHGGPVRLVVPRLYFWKSAKWVTGIQFTARDIPGFWETRGYHNHGDPWKEERYSY